MHDPCRYLHDMPYGYYSTRKDILFFFKEGYGSCLSKHAVIATINEKLFIPIFKQQVLCDE